MAFPDICVEDRMACPNERPTLLFAESTCDDKIIQIRDRIKGCEIDLTGKRVCLVFNDVLGCRKFEVIIEAEILEPEEGIVKITVNNDDTSKPGLWLGEFQVLLGGDTEDSSSTSVQVLSEGSSSGSGQPPALQECTVVDRLPCYVEIAPSVQDMYQKVIMPITIGEVRMAIRDKCHLDNFLLDHVQFSDTEIAWAIRRPVEWWNETPPPIETFSPATFPYRYNHLNAIVGELLTMVASLNEERNKLTYSAAGLQVGDKDKGQSYAQAGQMLIRDYREWALGKKKSLNMAKAFQRTSIRSFGNTFGRSDTRT